MSKSSSRKLAPIVLLVGPSCVGKSTICGKIIEINNFHLSYGSQGFEVELWGQDLAKEAHDRDGETGYRPADIFGRAIGNSKRGITTILDLGSAFTNILSQFEDNLNKAKDADPIFNPPVLKYAIYLPLDRLFERLFERNKRAEEKGQLHIDGRYGAPVLLGYVGLVCNLNPAEVDSKRLTGEELNETKVHEMLQPLVHSERVNLSTVLRNVGFVDGKAIIGIRDEKFDKFFSNESLEKAEAISEEIFAEIAAVIEQERSGLMLRTAPSSAEAVVSKSRSNSIEN
jgi:adenylate kinase family enzyme